MKNRKYDECGREAVTLAEVIARAKKDHPDVAFAKLMVTWEWCCCFPDTNNPNACHNTKIIVKKGKKS